MYPTFYKTFVNGQISKPQDLFYYSSSIVYIKRSLPHYYHSALQVSSLEPQPFSTLHWRTFIADTTHARPINTLFSRWCCSICLHLILPTGPTRFINQFHTEMPGVFAVTYSFCLSQYIREAYGHKERKGHPKIAWNLKETVSIL